MKRLGQRLIVLLMVVGAVSAAVPSSFADDAASVSIPDPTEGSIGGGGSTNCPSPTAGWDINVSPPDVRVYADPGKICLEGS